jgi:protoheme IX farnesyltransferase
MQTGEALDSRGPHWARTNGVAKHIGIAKLSLCYVMTASALAAYVVREPALDLTALGTMLCVFSLCLGAATLNNYQDRHVDAKLRRTCERPLASGSMGTQAALFQAAILVLVGTLGLLLIGESVALPTTGLIAICFYNGIYTPLKKTTVLAIVPGAVCGVLPVLMGWMAAGGALSSPKLWILMALFGVWQLPHFWLVVLANQEDYNSSGIPSMLRVLSVRQLRQLVFLWSWAFVVLTLCLPLYRVILSEAAAWVLFVNALVLASVFGFLLYLHGDGNRYRELFRYLNLSLAVVMGVILVDGIVLSYMSQV